MPWAASIEPTTHCNLRCSECLSGMQSLSRPKGNMKMDVFRRIIDHLSPNLIYLTLYFQGEPFLNPQFSEMVKLARQRRIFVSTSTNGHFLNDQNISQIMESGLNHLIISLDGLDQQTYQKYRQQGNLDVVIAGINRLVAAKKANKTLFPIVELQFLVMGHNQHQIREMKEFARNSGIDKLAFKTAQVNNFQDGNALIPTLKSKSRYKQLADNSWVLKMKPRDFCHRIWSSLVVTWDGKAVPCCYDKNAGYRFGDLLEESISKIWKNQQIASFRKKILENRNDIDICRNCGE